MAKTMKNILTLKLLIVLLAFSGLAISAAPEVPSLAPYIVLSDNLDEPNNYGFCIDTLSRGKNDLMQAHTCKPAREGAERDAPDNDVRFDYDPETLQIVSYAYEGYCMQALIAINRGGISGYAFGLLECDSELQRQKFVYDEDSGTLRLHEDQGQCIGVAPETQVAGPWVARPLVIEACGDLEDSLKQWTVVPE